MTTPPSSSSASQSQFAYSNPSYFPVPFHLQQPATTHYAAPYVAAPSVQIPAPPVVGPVAPAPVPAVYSAVPQYQAQQLFERDAQIITPEALENVKAAIASSDVEHKTDAKRKAVPRKAAGQSWEDPILAEWPEDDYRLFCGDLGNEVNDDVLSKAFSRFPSFNMARVSPSCCSLFTIQGPLKLYTGCQR
ncbi:RNA-binding protein 42 isoform X2 [Vigna radiata var. radiata]|uniref:RNA-binding protein 42 isoform X2 n=1 Tax=Vigna radiata var. radiata TaxID=3916 RepID=A0A3Q0FAW1_VIGRR|nr:RNA-binding protein 42 isoform X2 [Vigna radiata var. radiata]